MRDRAVKKAADLNIPSFTILACDDLAVGITRRWIKRAIQAQVNPEKVAEAKKLVMRMEAWRKLNPSECKMPD